MQSRRHPGWREEGRSISFGNVGEWPFPLMRGRLFASSARSCNQDSERDSGNQDNLAGVVRQAISYGLDPVSAIIAATSSPAARMDLRDRGRIAPRAPGRPGRARFA